MANQAPHITLKECRKCVVLMQDTFAGVLSDRMPNNCRMQISAPIAYFRSLEKQLNDSLHKRGVKGNYTTTIKVNPKDNRSFLSATFRYGRRLLTYTNVTSLPNQRTKQTSTFCIKQSTVTATRTIRPAGSAAQWITEHEEAWKKARYKGRFVPYDTANGTVWTGNFDHAKEDKHIKLTTKRTSKRSVTFTLVQTVVLTENIYAKDKPQIWVKDIDREMKQNKFSGSITTHVNSYDKLIIDGTYRKTIKVDKNGTNAYVVRFFNQVEKVSSKPIEDTDSWRPVKKAGNGYMQVRSIAQDDTYTPEFRGKKINWEHIDINKLYKEYLQMPTNELELAEKRFEQMDERAASKGQKAVQRWLRSIKKSKPQWTQAPNAHSLALYCIKYIEREVMTPSEATNFCKNNAYQSKLSRI